MGTSRFNLNKARVGGGKGPSTKLPTGRYRVRLEKNLVKPSEDGTRAKSDIFISEFTVVEVYEGGTGMKDKHGNEYPDTKAGDYRSWALNMGHANAPGNLNEFLAAVDGVDPTDPEALKEAALDFDELLEVALDTKNEMRGAEVDVTVGLKPTRQGNEFMAHKFSVAS